MSVQFCTRVTESKCLLFIQFLGFPGHRFGPLAYRFIQILYFLLYILYVLTDATVEDFPLNGPRHGSQGLPQGCFLLPKPTDTQIDNLKTTRLAELER